MLEYVVDSEVFGYMNEKNSKERLEDIIARFLEVYKILSPEARITFDIEIARKTGDMDDRTKKLYEALTKAAKDGLNVSETLSQMSKSK
jgi:hypothetical protein